MIEKKKTIDEKEKWLKLRIDLKSVWGPFSDVQPRVVRWRNDLTRPGFFFGELHLKLNIEPRGPTTTVVFLSLQNH